MFKSYLTTTMVSGGKLLEERFANISKPKKRSCKFGVLSAVITILIISTGVFTSAVLADNLFSTDELAVMYNGEKINLQNKPFTDNSEYYFPLREILNICGVSDENITYSDGEITMLLHSNITDSDFTAHINIGYQNIKFDDDGIAGRRVADNARTTVHPVLMRNNITYVPLGMLISIKHYNIDNAENERVSDIRFANTKPVKLLCGLKIRRYDSDGSFDVLLTDWTTADSANPEDYYEYGEKVLIGTADVQESLGYEDNEINHYLFPLNPIKRILTDGDSNAIAIVPVENQRHEALNSCMGETRHVSHLGWRGEIASKSIGIAESNPKDLSTFKISGYTVADPETFKGGKTIREICSIPVELIVCAK